MNLTEQEIQDLEKSSTVEEWNAACDRVKAARNGVYPEDSYVRVLASGIAARAQIRFAS